jgi:hypothetical protein
MRELLPRFWTDADLVAHLEDCPRVVDVASLDDSSRRLLCCCGEASRHTLYAIARAEVDLLTTAPVTE